MSPRARDPLHGDAARRFPDSAFRVPISALLLLGPTGAGKTPLGEWLEREGWGGRRCAHLDFGRELRGVADAGGAAFGLDAHEEAVVRRVLEEGALLEDAQSAIAIKILLGVVQRHGLGPADLLILNGLPRHVGQARLLEPLVRMERVSVLACDAETVRRRIALDAGGDRGGRRDDAAEDIARKLAWFEERTAPLIAHYREKGVSVVTVHVTVRSQPQEIARQLAGEKGTASP